MVSIKNKRMKKVKKTNSNEITRNVFNLIMFEYSLMNYINFNFDFHFFFRFLFYCVILLCLGVCTNATAPSVSSINRILRNRAAERAAAEFARAAGYGLYPPNPYGGFPWPSPAHLWPPGSGFPGISPGSTTASGTAGSPGSGSHDTLGSSDGSRMIGTLNGLRFTHFFCDIALV